MGMKRRTRPVSAFAKPSTEPTVLQHAGQLASDQTYETLKPFGNIDGLAFELYHSYRHGWSDGARGAAEKDSKFVDHPTRPDLRAEYNRGWDEGVCARADSLHAAAKRVGFVPNPLRVKAKP